MKNSPSSTPSHEEIVVRAHRIWIHAGRLAGRDLEYWFQAEAELRKERQIASRTTTPASTGSNEQPQSGQPAGGNANRASERPIPRAGSSATKNGN